MGRALSLRGPHAPLPRGDEPIAPLCDMLDTLWQRYRRPMIDMPDWHTGQWTRNRSATRWNCRM